MNTPRTLVALLSLAILVAACGGGTASPAPESPGAPSPVAPTDPPPATEPGDGGDDGTDTGVIVDPGPVDPGEPEPQLVEPVPGATLIRDSDASALDAAVNGRRVAVRIAWWGGVEPCSVLAGVDVLREGSTFTFTLKVGSVAAPDTACIDMAVYKATIYDLGELEPGTYTLVARGAPPVTVTVS
jgi:hypothetical protein